MKLEVLPVRKYKNYFIDLSTDDSDVMVDWDDNSNFVRIWNSGKPTAVCHVDNVDNLIEALELIKTKFKK